MPGTDAESYPLISVVMNCYNGESFLRKAIDSVYAQTWPHWEIVFWDNASTDTSGEIARSYDQRLRYYRAEQNTPLGEARNLAFALARGEFIAMLDCDDVWLPDTLQHLAGGMQDETRQYVVCYGGIARINASGEKIGRMIPPERQGNLFGLFLRQFDIMPCASMVRRSVLLESGHEFDPTLTASEDYCFFMTLAVDHPFHSIARGVAHYRIHEGALTNRTISKWADEWESTLFRIRESHPGIEKRYRAEFRHAFARIDYYRARNLIHLGDSTGARRLLQRNVFVDFRYLGLFLISLLPPTIWNLVHSWYQKRTSFS
jgi:glycosyltransferase involved in cell wall biosynthesis